VASLARTALEIKHSTKEEYGVNPEEELFKGGLLFFGIVLSSDLMITDFSHGSSFYLQIKNGSYNIPRQDPD
jgi:hypothetical protein